MARRSEHSQEEIREMVLNAAETIVIEEGFKELKARKIAMDIGYTVGSIYMVFENMADLIMHIKGRTLDEILELLNQKKNIASPDEAIKQLAKSYYHFASNHYNRWSMIFEHRLSEDVMVPDWYQNKIDNIFSLVESKFNQLTDQHSVEQNQLAARSLWSGVHGICTIALNGKMDLLGNTDVEQSVMLLVENFIIGWEK